MFPWSAYNGTQFAASLPLNQVPWITHGDVVLGDSTFIVEYLKNTYKGQLRLKEPETPQEQATNVSCLQICGNDLVYGLLYFRFVKPKVRDKQLWMLRLWSEISIVCALTVHEIGRAHV